MGTSVVEPVSCSAFLDALREFDAAEAHWAEKERQVDQGRSAIAKAFVDQIRFDDGVRHDDGQG